jgi:hypothetical protein
MEYRGKQYSVILSIGGKWKRSAEIEGQYRSGTAADRPSGIKLAERAMTRRLHQRKNGWRRRAAKNCADVESLFDNPAEVSCFDQYIRYRHARLLQSQPGPWPISVMRTPGSAPAFL